MFTEVFPTVHFKNISSRIIVYWVKLKHNDLGGRQEDVFNSL